MLFHPGDPVNTAENSLASSFDVFSSYQMVPVAKSTQGFYGKSAFAYEKP